MPSEAYSDYEEGAWSVSFDDGDTWNQLSLIDTYIHYLSDVAVSPDCNKMFLVSVNDRHTAPAATASGSMPMNFPRLDTANTAATG